MYDARIAREGVVPTRDGSWHDLLNALVWAAFPRAKRALHRRQHAIVAPAPQGVSSRRTREGDCLALLDEGGVLLAGGTRTVFGHAVFESLVLGRVPLLASTLDLPAAPDRDRALAALLEDPSRLVAPDELGRARIVGSEITEMTPEIEPATPREKARPAG